VRIGLAPAFRAEGFFLPVRGSLSVTLTSVASQVPGLPCGNLPLTLILAPEAISATSATETSIFGTSVSSAWIVRVPAWTVSLPLWQELRRPVTFDCPPSVVTPGVLRRGGDDAQNR